MYKFQLMTGFHKNEKTGRNIVTGAYFKSKVPLHKKDPNKYRLIEKKESSDADVPDSNEIVPIEEPQTTASSEEKDYMRRKSDAKRRTKKKNPKAKSRVLGTEQSE